MTVEGLKATKVLASEGVKVNVTLIFSANQHFWQQEQVQHMYHHSLDVWMIFHSRVLI